MAKGRFWLRSRQRGTAHHFEGPFGPMDVELVEEDSQRRYTLRGPEVGTGELILPSEMTTTARRDIMRGGITVSIGGTTVRLVQHSHGLRRSRRTVSVERSDRPPAFLRLRRWDAMSLERPGRVRLVRMGWLRGRVWDPADATDVAVLVLADRAGLRQEVALG